MKKKNPAIPALSLALCLTMSLPLSACAAGTTNSNSDSNSNPEDIKAITNLVDDTNNQNQADDESVKLEVKDGSAVFPAGITSIGREAFIDNEELTSVVIPDGVTEIGNQAFSGCKNLTSVTIPDSVTKIGLGAFFQCEKLTSVALPKGLTTLEYSLFYGCSNLTDVTIPDSVTKLNEEVFNYCESLTNVVIPNGVTEIGQLAFANCTKLASVTIPESVKTMGENIFLDCKALTIYGVAGSQAESYAKEASLPFANKPAGASTATPGNDTTKPTAAVAFTDVVETSPFIDGIRWAVEKNITAGTGNGTTFSPNDKCKNGQILTFLWRANGSPEPTLKTNPYSDSSSIPAAFQKAALWAYEKGLVSGPNFNADMLCTRSMAVTYLWVLAGSPKVATAASFTDVSSESGYAEAVSWAVEKGITTGKTGAMFAPEDTCTRGQIVTFLYRDMGK